MRTRVLRTSLFDSSNKSIILVIKRGHNSPVESWPVTRYIVSAVIETAMKHGGQLFSLICCPLLLGLVNVAAPSSFFDEPASQEEQHLIHEVYQEIVLIVPFSFLSSNRRSTQVVLKTAVLHPVDLAWVFSLALWHSNWHSGAYKYSVQNDLCL